MQDNPRTQSSAFVSSQDVNGTEVYNRKREHAGTIDHLMIDKKTGKVAYAIMRFGGFLGMGESEYPIPWGSLTYDTEFGGFVTDISPDQLRSAPELPVDWHNDRQNELMLFDHYRAPYYWV